MEKHVQLSDAEFETQFASGHFDPALFSHEAHLRLAWIHLRKYGLEQGSKNVESQILNFVRQLGLVEKFNKTLTIASIKIVYHFLQKSDTTNFVDFIQTFPRLKSNFKDLLFTHYSLDIFHTAKAKTTYLPPDLLAFD